MIVARAAVAFAVVVGLSAPAYPQHAAVKPETFFRHADFGEARLSPSGDTIAVIVPLRGRRSLVAIDLATRTPRVVASADRDVRTFHWVTDQRLVFQVFDLSNPKTRGNYAWWSINVDGSDARFLTNRTVTGVIRDEDAVLVQGGRRYLDVYRIDLKDRRESQLSYPWPGDPIKWIVDRHGVARAVLTTERGLRVKTWIRKGADAPWQLVGEYDNDSAIEPVAFDEDGSLIVASTLGRDTAALYRLDGETLRPGELLAAHPHADIRQVWVSGSRVVGAHYDDGRPGDVWFDDRYARVADAVNRALPGRYNRLSGGGGDRFLVHSSSDTDPGSWYLFDAKARRLEFLFGVWKDFKAETMPQRQVLRYAARDGLSIPAVLTLPKGREPRALPLVLLVHGGPSVRGTQWTWQAEPAFLASLGYAVLEPDFRGSAGWGRKHLQAGYKQWGLAMQDDLLDGIDALAAKGTIDPSRVCIMGVSYGGFAVMSGLSRDPDRFRCGINLLGVTDVKLLLDISWSDNAYSDFMLYRAKDVIGDSSKDADALRAGSPVANAAKIRAPVMMVYNVLDRRVPLEHGERMRNALRAHGKAFEYVMYDDEGHGFALEKNRLDLYGRIAAFLREHLPPE